MRVSAVTVVSIVLLVSHPLAAQATAFPQLRVGDRVRVTTSADGGRATRVARFVREHGDTLYVRVGGSAEASGDSLALPMAGLTRVEIGAGERRHTWPGAGIGTVVGGVIGYLSAGDECNSAALPGACATGNAVAARSVERGASTFSGAVLGALGGAVAGHFWKSERWQLLPLPP